ncbi:MAG TPA: hypothetical protein DEE98_07095 [Elusimicrobia bacterium]|nr:MAG: hypothetical protein A2278_00270 [Elusimicrobia bacterium RIFOXYA12_FULL_49_49]OGS06553.1 MAG: hypothetical protein A2204_03025 [Elusimicrobia bacterium RIFOXYA1_FULL_47_7]OGS15867.1 MAG: hypothetical protein A2251_04405 [Elusimicrobia bacterium RIFOXYA2_FULL_47_53]OGS27161.1 MAG: hypothetical protein A2339_00655 [Elusimicrobia bacterium RIFOXYB12_FULL_50_12]OGS31200.1 MAG: hypothetical protein A2323_09125 [Elusimicrobia bacterium RIFOXYB2_FULL_46_23]HBU70131.1 hypothetical protein [El
MAKIAITSAQNQKIKHIRKLLDDRRYRYECGEYVIEGTRALDNLKDAPEIYLRQGVTSPGISAETAYVLDEKVFDAISSTENSQGVIAIAKLRLKSFKEIDKNTRYALLDRIQDPGNIGTIIRSALAFGFKGIIITPGTADPFAPKTARAASSALNLLDIVKIDHPSELSGFNVIAADARGAASVSFNWPKAFILAVGSEGSGLSEEISAMAPEKVAVPISDKIESLNAAVSAAILMYCASTSK